jgi:FixJ family two-component response regulator
MNLSSEHMHETSAARELHATPVVYVVDDDISVRESLELLIRCNGWRPEAFETGEEFLSRPPVFAPSCLLLDHKLPNISGLALQRRLVAERVYMPVIFVSCYGDVPLVVEAMRAGAIEFLNKPFNDGLLLAAITEALECSRKLLRRQAASRVLAGRYASLTRREREVMRLVVAGMKNKAVGVEMNISEITVKAHRGKVMQKMQADSLAALVTMAAELRELEN